MWVVLVIVLTLIVAFVVVVQRSGGFSFPWVQFYVKGKESGYTFSELNLLRKVAVENRLKNPTSLFWSERTLDRCIRGTIIKFRSLSKENDPGSVEFLARLFEFRKRVEFNLPKYRLGIRSSRNVSTGQRLKLTFPGSGIYTSGVVENIRKYIAVSYPKGKPLPPGFSWQGQKVSVYFWRPEDAGYYFEAKILGDYLDRKFPILHLAHSDQLIRAQKRGSIRAELHANGRVYSLQSIEQANEEPDRTGGYKCKMVDISEDGAAVLVGGKAKPGLAIKIVTDIDSQDVVVCGTVRGVTYKEKNNVSILHIQAARPSAAMKNRILTYVYGIFGEHDRSSSIPASATPAAEPRTDNQAG
ncbi:MAG TPA: flagellar brake protein [Spirochaetia bacterium]|nr:flagellar brake protein [Spirochaetia bacterium]